LLETRKPERGSDFSTRLATYQGQMLHQGTDKMSLIKAEVVGEHKKGL
jgi:hypothetical protein